MLLRQVASSLGVDSVFRSKIELEEKQATRVNIENLTIFLDFTQDQILKIMLSDKVLFSLKKQLLAFNALNDIKKK